MSAVPLETEQESSETSKQLVYSHIDASNSNNKNPLPEIALQAAFLGVIFGASFIGMFLVNFKQFCLYLVALLVFHFMEYYITAKYNPSKVTVELFLITHSGAYTLAHFSAMIEGLLEYYFFPEWKVRHKYISLLGIILILMGQVLRLMAMKTAGESFSHVIATQKQENHILVTSGVYHIFRHPSYTGYFWWAIGSQVLLMNPICIIGFAIVLYKFFKHRITYEEQLLVSFFGKSYLDYRWKTGVYIPFIH